MLEIPTKQFTHRLVWGTGTDAYADPDIGATAALLTEASQFRVHRCDTKGALISINGETTHVLEAIAGVNDNEWFCVGQGAVIKAKNETAGQNFAKLVLEVAVG